MFVFSTVIQVLNYIPSFRNYVHELSMSDPKIQALKCLFLELHNSSVAVRRGKYLQVFCLNGYIPDQQYDAYECLVELLQKFCPEVNDHCIFKISLLESTMCEENCGDSTENTFSCIELGL